MDYKHTFKKNSSIVKIFKISEEGIIIEGTRGEEGEIHEEEGEVMVKHKVLAINDVTKQSIQCYRVSTKYYQTGRELN